jgi:hypothetical protein
MAFPEESIVSTAMGGAKLALDGRFEKDPRTRQYAEVLRNVVLEVTEAMFRDPETIKRFRDMQVNLFMETYTESELREIIKFYRTPIGRKAIQTFPEVSRKGMERGADIGGSLAGTPKFKELLDAKLGQLVAEGKLPKQF